MDYDVALLLDLFVFASCAVLLVRYGRMTMSHPAAVYLVFHAYVVTWRLVSLRNGAPTLFSEWGPSYEPVHPEELVRASLYADAVLVAVTIAWLYAARRYGPLVAAARYRAKPKPNLRKDVTWVVVLLALPFAIFGFVTSARFSGTTLVQSNLGSLADSGYYQILESWPGLLLLVLMYVYGLRWYLLLPMVLYLVPIGLQGYQRYRLIIPVLAMLQIYLERQGRAWPRLRGTALVLLMALLFFPLKEIGKGFQSGESFADIVDDVINVSNKASTGRADDQQFLDEFASSLTLSDWKGKLYWGQPYLALLALPVPHTWWKGKPSVGDYIRDLSSSDRPMGTSGMIVTIWGETYANFGFIGMLLVPAGFAVWVGRYYFRSRRKNYFTFERLSYLALSVNLIQVYRDGLTSVVFFTFVNMMPVMLVVVAHVFWIPLAGIVSRSWVAGRIVPRLARPGRNLLSR
jgi:hypothetical protein